ncbi:transcriptional regulator [Streptomyces sp. 110]|uniref:Transcriptional regulator n=1 Tax=Streptomyces endocoffeicus TaxID=2898945 RepID=A0ABS1PS67_9ACTN|nr:helix-turn-helix domain-containing protein [Streptomyces endocoffeicus]MBL1115279.1 transcriptional regulator [Streptomyces endocoffeicus]
MQHFGGTVTVPERGSRLGAGAHRDRLAAKLRKKYEGGMSIRALADKYGRSYGFIHRLLGESGVEFRGRGGANRRSADSS